jgi:hypothetical protein
MFLFCWSSEALRQYSDGNIVAIAANVDDARLKVVERLKKDYFEHIVYLEGFTVEDFDSDDIEAENYDRFFKRLQKDLGKAPSTDSVFYFKGSE